MTEYKHIISHLETKMPAINQQKSW